MLLKDNKKGLVTLIMKKMKGGDHDLSPSFSSETAEPKKLVDGAEQDCSIAVESAAEELLGALESKDPKAVVRAFKSLFILMEDLED